MIFQIEKVTGIGEFERVVEKREGISTGHAGDLERTIFKVGERAFAVVNEDKTLEVRTDFKLGKMLSEKYETVMGSRYFGRGGVEVILAGDQLSEEEVYDLVRLSYNMTNEME